MARTSSKSKIVKAIPSSEVIKVTCTTSDNGKYIITHNPLKEQFTLWKRLEDGYERIKSSDNPLDFDKIIPW